MADKKGLERIGIAFGLVTALVVLTAAAVVKSHVEIGPGIQKPPIVSAALGAIVR